MATMRDVIRAYRPELELEEPVPDEEAMAFLVEKTGLTPEQIESCFNGLAELALWHLSRAHPVRLPGTGSLYPSIDIQGRVRAAIETDPDLMAKLNEAGAYLGGINRRENIGVPLERLAQMWNSANPDDPVTDIDLHRVSAV